MDIVSMSTSLAAMQLNDQVGVALMNMAKDQMEQSGEQMAKSLQSMGGSLDPNVGRNIDISI